MNKVEEGNVIIAQFLKWGVDCPGEATDCGYIPDEDHIAYDSAGFLYPKELQFHCSWDWLMPVVEKIEREYEVSIIGNECEIAETGYEWKSICRSTSESKIDAVWQTCVKFITWYNENIIPKTNK